MSLPAAPSDRDGCLVFVYGTLKTGFRNHPAYLGHLAADARLPGDWQTLLPWPLYIVGPWRLPWLLPRPGEGLPVRGELWRVDAATLASIDALELVDQPRWYHRGELQLRSLRSPTGEPISALSYFGCPLRFEEERVHAGPLAEYCLHDDRRCLDDSSLKLE